jgi:hypothetical protein
LNRYDWSIGSGSIIALVGSSEVATMFRWLRREPKELIERRLVLSPGLQDYPLYQPPHSLGPLLRRRADQTDQDFQRYSDDYSTRSKQNFAYFIEQRAARLGALKTFLAGFGVSADLDDAGLASVSAWLADNSFALADVRKPDVRGPFYQMRIPWTGDLRGLNVIFDLGVFLGELLIQKQRRLHWKYIPVLSDDGYASSTGYNIDGFRGNTKVKWLDPGTFILTRCFADLNDLHSYSPRPRALRNYNILVGVVRDYATR